MCFIYLFLNFYFSQLSFLFLRSFNIPIPEILRIIYCYELILFWWLLESASHSFHSWSFLLYGLLWLQWLASHFNHLIFIPS